MHVFYQQSVKSSHLSVVGLKIYLWYNTDVSMLKLWRS